MGITQEAYQNLLSKKAELPQKTIPPQSEQSIQLSIIKYLRAKGYSCGKTKTFAMPTKTGVYRKDIYAFRGKCDLEAFAPSGIMYGIEVKSKLGILSGGQKEYQRKFHRPPWRIYIEAHCLEDVIEKVEIENKAET